MALFEENKMRPVIKEENNKSRFLIRIGKNLLVEVAGLGGSSRVSIHFRLKSRTLENLNRRSLVILKIIKTLFPDAFETHITLDLEHVNNKASRIFEMQVFLALKNI